MADRTELPPDAAVSIDRGEAQSLIDRMWDFGDPAASEARFRRAADDTSLPVQLRAVMATQLARALGLQRRADEAEAVLAAVEAAATGEGADAAELRARVALERGRAIATGGHPAASVPLFTRAVREAATAGSTFLVLDGLHMLALNDAGHEEEWAAEGFDVLEGVTDPRLRRWGVALHNNLGWLLHDRGEAGPALTHFEAAREAADRYGTAEQRHVARWAIARALRSLGRRDEALAIQRELAAARPDDPYVREELAELGDDAADDGAPGSDASDAAVADRPSGA